MLKLGSQLLLDFPHPKDVARRLRLHSLIPVVLAPFGRLPPRTIHFTSIRGQEDVTDFDGDLLQIF